MCNNSNVLFRWGKQVRFMTMSDSLVIVPTYNEAHNIRKLIHKVMSLEPKLDLLIIDDASPDGTAESVRELQVEYSGRLHLLEREGKLGLGTAYVEGFRFALKIGRASCRGRGERAEEEVA